VLGGEKWRWTSLASGELLAALWKSLIFFFGSNFFPTSSICEP